MREARVFSINYSKVKGVSKKPVSRALLIEGLGMDKDAHAGPGIRQVSLLSIESIRGVSLGAGDFAENITTEGIDLAGLKINDKLKIGQSALLEISKIGKECHKQCAIYYKIGDCIMPREGIFAQVLKGGEIKIGDNIERIKDAKRTE